LCAPANLCDVLMSKFGFLVDDCEIWLTDWNFWRSSTN